MRDYLTPCLVAKHLVNSSSPDSAQSSAPIDLPLVRRLFSTPERVAESGFLRREVAGRMRERLELVKIAPQRMVDAGCGEGADLPMLQQLFADSHLLGVDAAPAMLRVAHARQEGARSAVNRLLTNLLPKKMRAGTAVSADLLCADFAQLPLPAASVDLVWSNLALHWHPQPDRVFAEWRRVLRTDGLLMFSCFGPDTFKELRSAFASAGAVPSALPFVDMHDFGDMLVGAGFSTPVMDMESITVTYPSVDRLLEDVRAWGGNPLASRRKGLMGRVLWNRVRDALSESVSTDGRLSLSFELIYGHAFRPAPQRKARDEAVIRFDWPKK